MKSPEQQLSEGKTVRFVFHEFSNREPVELFIAKHDAVGQQELPLWGMGLISVWKPQKEDK